MTARQSFPDQGDRSRPPLFSPAEWQRIVHELALSLRQAEIVGFIVQGKSDKEIERLLAVKLDDPQPLRGHPDAQSM